MMSAKCSSISFTVYSHNINYNSLLGVYQCFPGKRFLILLTLLDFRKTEVKRFCSFTWSWEHTCNDNILFWIRHKKLIINGHRTVDRNDVGKWTQKHNHRSRYRIFNYDNSILAFIWASKAEKAKGCELVNCTGAKAAQVAVNVRLPKRLDRHKDYLLRPKWQHVHSWRDQRSERQTNKNGGACARTRTGYHALGIVTP